MIRFYRDLMKKKLLANCSGQAAAELAGAMLIIVPLLCATIDFGRAFYQLQVVSELSRQGSSLAMRGEGTTSCDTMCTAIADLVAGSSGLNLAANGKVIMTALTPTASQNQRGSLWRSLFDQQTGNVEWQFFGDQQTGVFRHSEHTRSAPDPDRPDDVRHRDLLRIHASDSTRNIDRHTDEVV